MRVDLVGPLPPPLGGVSVHIERLRAGLRLRGHRVTVHPPPGREAVAAFYHRVFRDSRGADVLHSHLCSPLPVALFSLFGVAFGPPVVLTLHGRSFASALRRRRDPARARAVWGLRRCHAIIAVSDAIAEDLAALGVDGRRVTVAPAFLPPDPETLRAAAPAPDAAALLRTHAPVLCANAYRTQVVDGELVYGEALLIELLARLRRHHPHLGLVLHVAADAPGDAARRARLRARAQALGVRDHIGWVLGSQPFGPTLVRSAAMLRPTSTDGDAISVREALHCGVPVLASDRAARPLGTRVVPYGDVDAWERVTLEALAERPAAGATWPQAGSLDSILSVYESVLRR